MSRPPGRKCGDPTNPDGPGRKANGDPCENVVVHGGTRCSMHGGCMPAAKIKAEQAMAICRLPAIEALWRILDQFDSETCVTCGFPKGDTDEKRMIVRTCQTILDRSGMGPHSVLDVRQSDGDMDLAQWTDNELTRLDALFAGFDELKAEVALRLHGRVFGMAPIEQQKPSDVIM